MKPVGRKLWYFVVINLYYLRCPSEGLILGPLLFLICVYDMSAVVKQTLLLYADYSAFLASFKDKQDIETLLSSEVNIVRQ